MAALAPPPALAGMTRRDTLRAAFYAAVLLWVNAYICRTWLFHPTAYTNTLDGYWIALARLGQGWLAPSWWPYWDLGIPFQFTSAPMVPAMTAAVAACARIPLPMALQAVKAIFYCAAPLALFALSLRITGAAGYSFAAALFYSLLSPAKILAPDAAFSWSDLFTANRFALQVVWDETPRVAAVTFLMLFLYEWWGGPQGGPPGPRPTPRSASCPSEGAEPVAPETAPGGPARTWGSAPPFLHAALAATFLALAMLASPFALPAAALAILSLHTARPQGWRRTTAIVILACALAAPFLPPSLWRAMALASAAHEPWGPGWSLLKLLAGSAVVWVTLAHYLSQWIADSRLRFFILLTVAMSWGPVLSVWLRRQVLPQPQHFRMEMEPAIALAVVFGLRPGIERLPRWAKTALACALLLVAGQQTLERRRVAKDLLLPADVTRTIEYRTAIRVAQQFPHSRVMLPGSIAQWANAFTELAQFAGGEGVAAYSQRQQRALTAIYRGAVSPAEDARIALAWMKAHGVAAVVVPGPLSRESWKPFAHPEKFDGVLPCLWTEEGVTAYRVPQRTASLAHVVPESALVTEMPARPEDTAALDRYNAVLDDPALPESTLEWQGRNRLRIRTVAAPGQAISIQVSYHPGWHATANGRSTEIHSDGLGLMWLRPGIAGPAVVELDYDGGWELRICRWIGLAAILAAVLCEARGRHPA